MTSEIKKKSLLVVDVEVDLLDVLSELLEIAGYEVTKLKDLRQIFQLFETKQFDIVLSHWHDPYVQVEEIFDRLSVSCPETKLIVMTGSIDVGEEIKNKYPIIYKPFLISDLEKLIRPL
jgi:DNA-binding NtrC family response regulator